MVLVYWWKHLDWIWTTGDMVFGALASALRHGLHALAAGSHDWVLAFWLGLFGHIGFGTHEVLCMLWILVTIVDYERVMYFCHLCLISWDACLVRCYGSLCANTRDVWQQRNVCA